MIKEIDYGMTDPVDQQLLDDGVAFNGSGFTVRIEFLQIGGLVWAAGQAYVVGELIRPTVGNGRLYVCTVAGTSDALTEPTWPTTPGGTVVDGTVTWQEMTPIAQWSVQAAGQVRVTGHAALPRDTSYRVRYVVTDGLGTTAPFANGNRYDVWRVQAVMAG